MIVVPKRPDFLALNPFGQVPVLDDDGTVVADANAILVYLRRAARGTAAPGGRGPRGDGGRAS
jgi:glutathione S-transferase